MDSPINFSSIDHARSFIRAMEANDRHERALHGLADILHEKLLNQIAEFESGLGQDEELGARLASFGQSVLIRVESIGFENPHFIVFYGRLLDSDQRVQLVQHTTQVNVLLLAVARDAKHKEPKRIGFHREEPKDT